MMLTLENGSSKLLHLMMNLLINLLIKWEIREITYEPLGIIAKSDPITCAIYAKENNLLDTPGWIQFWHVGKRS